MKHTNMPVDHHAEVLPGTASQAEPGDEVLYLDDQGGRQAVCAEFVLITPDRETVTLVSGSEQELVLPREQPVLLIRGAGPLWSMLGCGEHTGEAPGEAGT